MTGGSKITAIFWVPADTPEEDKEKLRAFAKRIEQGEWGPCHIPMK